MSNLASAFQPAIDALETDLADLERQGNALLTSINLLRAKVGLPPRPSNGFTTDGVGAPGERAATSSVTIHSDTFVGKKLRSAAREYLQMRKSAGGDAPATAREIFDALKEGGFSSGAKDDQTAMVVLRTTLRKGSDMFHRLNGGKWGLRSWYGELPRRRAAAGQPPDRDDAHDDIEPDDDDAETADTEKASAVA